MDDVLPGEMTLDGIAKRLDAIELADEPGGLGSWDSRRCDPASLVSARS